MSMYWLTICLQFNHLFISFLHGTNLYFVVLRSLPHDSFEKFIQAYLSKRLPFKILISFTSLEITFAFSDPFLNF